jgi:hypothetical protein
LDFCKTRLGSPRPLQGSLELKLQAPLTKSPRRGLTACSPIHGALCAEPGNSFPGGPTSPVRPISTLNLFPSPSSSYPLAQQFLSPRPAVPLLGGTSRGELYSQRSQPGGGVKLRKEVPHWSETPAQASASGEAEGPKWQQTANLRANSCRKLLLPKCLYLARRASALTGSRAVRRELL